VRLEQQRVRLHGALECGARVRELRSVHRHEAGDQVRRRMMWCGREHPLHVLRGGVELAQTLFGFCERSQHVGVAAIELDSTGED
jgi:hypothetical protein